MVRILLDADASIKLTYLYSCGEIAVQMRVSYLKLKQKPAQPPQVADSKTTDANDMGVFAAFQLIK